MTTDTNTDALAEVIRQGVSACEDKAYAVQARVIAREALPVLVERARLVDQLEAALDRTLYLAEHMFSMIPRQVWRDTGGDDGQGHYEGDYHAEKVLEELSEIRTALARDTERSGA